MTNVSKHITYAEATKSQEAVRLGIENKPTDTEFFNMTLVSNKCFEPLREHHAKPIGVSSFFRSAKINEKVGGSTSSQHCKGMAIDIDADIFNNGISNSEIFLWLEANVDFDQLIWEFGTDTNPAWVHISYNNGKNRKQKLRALKTGNSTQYIVI
jgi:hypothetical protein